MSDKKSELREIAKLLYEWCKKHNESYVSAAAFVNHHTTDEDGECHAHDGYSAHTYPDYQGDMSVSSWNGDNLKY